MGDNITVKYETLDDVPANWEALNPIYLKSEESPTVNASSVILTLIGFGFPTYVANAIVNQFSKELKYGERIKLVSGPGHLIDKILIENSIGEKKSFSVTGYHTNKTITLKELWSPGCKSKRQHLADEEEKKVKLAKKQEEDLERQRSDAENKRNQITDESKLQSEFLKQIYNSMKSDKAKPGVFIQLLQDIFVGDLQNDKFLQDAIHLKTDFKHYHDSFVDKLSKKDEDSLNNDIAQYLVDIYSNRYLIYNKKKQEEQKRREELKTISKNLKTETAKIMDKIRLSIVVNYQTNDIREKTNKVEDMLHLFTARYEYKSLIIREKRREKEESEESLYKALVTNIAVRHSKEKKMRPFFNEYKEKMRPFIDAYKKKKEDLESEAKKYVYDPLIFLQKIMKWAEISVNEISFDPFGFKKVFDLMKNFTIIVKEEVGCFLGFIEDQQNKNSENFNGINLMQEIAEILQKHILSNIESKTSIVTSFPQTFDPTSMSRILSRLLEQTFNHGSKIFPVKILLESIENIFNQSTKKTPFELLYEQIEKSFNSEVKISTVGETPALQRPFDSDFFAGLLSDDIVDVFSHKIFDADTKLYPIEIIQELIEKIFIPERRSPVGINSALDTSFKTVSLALNSKSKKTLLWFLELIAIFCELCAAIILVAIEFIPTLGTIWPKIMAILALIGVFLHLVHFIIESY